MKKNILIVAIVLSASFSYAQDYESKPKMGILGYPLTTELTIEGFMPAKTLIKNNSSYLLISSIDGKRLQSFISIQIKNVDFDSAEPGSQFILKGYENGEWVGCDTCETPKHFIHYFIVKQIESPKSLKLKTKGSAFET